MKRQSARSFYFAVIAAVLLVSGAQQGSGQTTSKSETAVMEGKVQDSMARPLSEAVVSLSGEMLDHPLLSASDAQGKFRFTSVPAGSYKLVAKLRDYQDCEKGPIVLRAGEIKTIVLVLQNEAASGVAKEASEAIAFSDEPSFTVAGVTDTTGLGGHGSGPIVRNSNALSKQTASLARDGATVGSSETSEAGHKGTVGEAEIRAALARKDDADLHVQLAELEESEGHPLEAVKEYQRAAEMQPTEAHLFAWGAELLLHHAPEPAIEVFSKGRRLYPQSSRMMLGLGAAWYSQRSKEQAAQIIMEACDLHPEDATPYLFLGRLQVTEQVVPTGWVERMKRFAQLHPEKAMAHYLYAVALMKQSGPSTNLDAAEAELNTAIKLDPHLGNAYLQLGILYGDRSDFAKAIGALQKAVELTPLPEEAHYRLGQIYRRMGDMEKANQEIAEYKKIAEQKDEQAERERHEIPQFVYTLRGESAPPPTTPAQPN